MRKDGFGGRIIGIPVFLLLAMGALVAAGSARAAGGSWWADVSYLYLVDETSSEDLFWVDANDDNRLDAGEKVFGTDRLQGLSFDAGNFGWRAEVGYDLPSGWTVSLAYMGRTFGRETRVEDRDENIEPRFGPSPNDTLAADLANFEDAGAINMELTSNLHSVELDLHIPLWRQEGRFALTGRVGPRITLIRDTMTLSAFDEPFSRDPGNRSDLNVDTENWLYGAQVGLGLRWRICPYFMLSADANVGGYYADIDQEVSFYRYRDVCLSSQGWSLEDSKGLGGLFGELRLGGEIKLAQSLSVRLGYMLLWFSDTGRALHQIKPGQGLDEDLDDIPRSSYPDVQDDSTLYHGALLSLAIRF